MNIEPVAFLDSWHFSSGLHVRYKDRFATSDDSSIALLPLRNEDEALPILAEWKAAKALLTRIRTAAAPLFGGQSGILGTAALIRLAPGGWLDWRVDEGEYAELHKSLHLCIVPSPGAWIYSGGEGAVLPVGQLTYVNRRVPYSALNLGHVPVIHLVVDVREPDDPLGSVVQG